jgi:K+/H+ antiporter YhaU regulatory subunit KhtT
VTLLKRAQDVFFARRDGETIDDMIKRQRETMALTLAIQTQHEVKVANDLGIVDRISYSGKFGSKVQTVSKDDDGIQNLDTKNLNMTQVKAL